MTLRLFRRAYCTFWVRELGDLKVANRRADVGSFRRWGRLWQRGHTKDIDVCLASLAGILKERKVLCRGYVSRDVVSLN
jgi:hypothetical protein